MGIEGGRPSYYWREMRYKVEGDICPTCGALSIAPHGVCRQCGFGGAAHAIRLQRQEEVFKKPLPHEAVLDIAHMLQPRSGVIGVMRSVGSDGQISDESYVIPMPRDEKVKKGARKFEHVFTETELLDYGSSADAKFDGVGGGVRLGEKVREALVREAYDELRQLFFDRNNEMVSLEAFIQMFGPIVIQDQEHLAPFMVLQTLQNGLEKPRGYFQELFWFTVLLSQQQIEMLESVGLQSVSSVDSKQLRPHLRVLQSVTANIRQEELVYA